MNRAYYNPDEHFDWKEVKHNDPTFGPLVFQARRVSLADVDSKTRAQSAIIETEDAKKNGVIQIRVASDVEGNTRSAWDTQVVSSFNSPFPDDDLVRY